jgi:NADPH-dependent 2,4-dienoyl-CoA reductase/sulfur reductase-like enzyme/rhodanese-related sulfurtransferase
MAEAKRIFIVGGVAGGASCAARARRLDEHAEIVLCERGPYVSFANCGLPYYVGRVIVREDDLLVATPELFRERFNIDVRTECNVEAVDPARRRLRVHQLTTGHVADWAYDALVLAPGSAPIRPRLPGIDLDGIFTLWTIPDTRRILDWIRTRKVKRAVVVGGGFIGLEMTENLHRLGIDVTIVEMQHQIMPALDVEMAAFAHQHLVEAGVEVELGCGVAGFAKGPNGCLDVTLADGRHLETDLVIMAAGVRPRTRLAAEAGLAIGERGGILVDEWMQTSDPHIWAVGDAVQVVDHVTGLPAMVPLAGPANRQGRIAANVICGKKEKYTSFRGVQATSICGVMGLAVAATGVTEKTLRRLDPEGERWPYAKIYIHPDHHAGYYPDAQTLTVKLIFDRTDGRILGAQAVGKEGADKRIDVIATHLQHRGTVFDLEASELCYAPQYGSAKDPVNLAGMVAANFLRGDVPTVYWEDLPRAEVFLLDVRTAEEYASGHVPGAVNIPIDELRPRLDELPKDREIWSYCYVGQRSYIGVRMMVQHGFDAKNITGGFRMYTMMD